MSKEVPAFKGFGDDIFKFLIDLEKNNNIEWFHKNKERYKQVLVEPARHFVNEVAPILNRLNPTIRTEPKFNKTLMRLNKDMRFAKGAPYKNYFLIHFGRFKLDSEYFLYFSPTETDLGIFINNSDDDHLFFRKNYETHKRDIVKIFRENRLNNRYSFHEMDKEPKEVIHKFNAEKHIDLLAKHRYILFQFNNFEKKHVATDDLLPLVVKVFLELYPLLCFAYFLNPLKEIEEFKESFGVIK